MKAKQKFNPNRKRKSIESKEIGVKTRSIKKPRQKRVVIFIERADKPDNDAKDITRQEPLARASPIKTEGTQDSRSELQSLPPAFQSAHVNNSKDIGTRDEQEILYDENKRYCKPCDRTYCSKDTLQHHMRNIHKLAIPKQRITMRNPHLQPDIYDPNFYCHACERTYPSLNSYRIHLKGIHKLEKLPYLERIVRPDLSPDINDPNSYCKACDKTLSNRHVYISHLNRIHQMNVSFPMKVAKPHLVPDINDPNFYCIACEKKFSRKRHFHAHVISTHKMTIPLSLTTKQNPIIHPHLTPDFNNPNLYCIGCEKTFVNKSKYRIHLIQVHKMLPPNRAVARPKKPIIHPHVKPDMNDPNYHCAACERTFQRRDRYRYHLKSVHDMKLPDLRELAINPNVLPDKDDPNFHCKSCKKTFGARNMYNVHLKRVHKMPPGDGRSSIIHPDMTPDPNDTNHYCNACERYHLNKAKYRQHLRKMYEVKLNRSIIIHPEVTLDPEDPDNFCAVCERPSKNRGKYREHLKLVHHLWLSPLQNRPSKIIHPDKAPDPKDPDHFCCACERYFGTVGLYRVHLTRIHKVVRNQRVRN